MDWNINNIIWIINSQCLPVNQQELHFLIKLGWVNQRSFPSISARDCVIGYLDPDSIMDLDVVWLSSMLSVCIHNAFRGKYVITFAEFERYVGF